MITTPSKLTSLLVEPTPDDITIAFSGQCVELDPELVKVRSDEIGNTELTRNPYKNVLRCFDKLKEEGLDPRIVHMPASGITFVTSSEQINRKLH